MTHLLEVRGVTSGYGRVRVLDGLTLAVPEGRVAVLLGANGAGKTTTLRTIAGLLPVWRGQVLLGGRRIDGREPLAVTRAGITLVPEGRGVFPALSVRENLEIAAHADRRSVPAARRAAVSSVLERLPQLAARLGQAAGTLSGGEQQMLALARGLLTAPRVLMIDELSTGLAPLVVEELFGIVGALKDSGQTILLVEQYLTHALRVADVCYVLHKGRLAFAGDPGEVRDQQQFAGMYLGA